MTFLTPYIIAYAAHKPNTRALRMGLFPIGLISTWAFITSLNIANEPRGQICFPPATHASS